MTLLALIDRARQMARKDYTANDICLVLDCHPETARAAIGWALSQASADAAAGLQGPRPVGRDRSVGSPEPGDAADTGNLSAVVVACGEDS